MPEILLIHIFGIILLALVTLILFVNIKKKGFDIFTLFVLLAVIFLLAMVLYKQPFYSLSTKLGFLRPFELFLTITSVLALLLAIKLYLAYKTTERDITTIVQHLGIKELKDKNRIKNPNEKD